MPSGNGTKPHVVDRVTSNYSYPAGTGIGIAYTYTAPDTRLRKFVMTFGFDNFLDGRKLTFWVSESARVILQQSYNVGGGPHMHAEFYSIGTIEVLMQVDVTMGGATNVPRRIVVQNAE